MIRYNAKSQQSTPYLSGISAEGLDFSRDGAWVTYVTFPEGDLWRSRVDGSDRLQLTYPPMKAALPRWSSDAKSIAFMAKTPGRHWTIHAVSADGVTLRQLRKGYLDEADPAWGPDGHSILYGPMTGGPFEPGIHRLDLGTAEVSKLPQSDGCFAPRPSPDGRLLAAVLMDSYRLLLFNFKTEKWVRLTDIPAGYPSWSQDGRHVYFSSSSAEGLSFFRVSVSDHKLERVAELTGIKQAEGDFGAWSGVTPDGSPLLLRDTGTREIYALDVELP